VIRLSGSRLLLLAAAGLGIELIVDYSNFLFPSVDAAPMVERISKKASFLKSFSDSFSKASSVSDSDFIIYTSSTDKPPAGEGEAKNKEAGSAPKEAVQQAKETPALAKDAVPYLPPVEDADRTLLERLSERRGELEKRSKDLTEREALLAAAEKQLEARMAELKAMDETLKADVAKKSADVATIKPLIVMYETMKPKEAARIFEKLDLKAVIPIASGMNPKKFSEVLAQIDPVVAGKLTVALAAPATAQNTTVATKGDLPELPDLNVPKTR